MAEEKRYKLQIMASDHMVYDGDAYSLIVPTTEGQIGILADHSNLIMTIVPGLLEYRPAGEDGSTGSSEREVAVVSEGLLKVESGEVMVLVDTSESPDEIDVERAGRSAERAREMLSSLSSDSERRAANAKLARAMSRLKATGRKGS